jgi:hypothetical protein
MTTDNCGVYPKDHSRNEGRMDLVHFENFCMRIVDIGKDHGRSIKENAYQSESL